MPNGKIVTAGVLNNYSGTLQSFVLQHLPNGTLDSTFNGNGILVFDAGTGNSGVLTAKATPDGKIIVGGRVSVDLYGIRHYALARINPDGTLDASFGTGGVVTTDFGNSFSTVVLTLDIQQDGKIVAGGMGFDNNLSTLLPNITLARYNPNGTLDNSFGTNGLVVTGYPLGIETNALAIESDGKIVVAGTAYGKSGFFLLRYKPDGKPDSLVGVNGILKLALGSDYETSYGLAIQPDGKIVMAGSVRNGLDEDFAVVRFIGGSNLHLGTVDFSASARQLLVYPNPIEQAATLEYTLPAPATVTLQLFDIKGALLKTCFSGQPKDAGSHSEAINLPEGLPIGNYVLKMSTPSGCLSVKVIKRS
jgi:uncharacterized delta-60 repeat protein